MSYLGRLSHAGAAEGLRNQVGSSAIGEARREHAYLPLLNHRDGSLTLHRVMAGSAEFLVSILRDVYWNATKESSQNGGNEMPALRTFARAKIYYAMVMRGAKQQFAGIWRKTDQVPTGRPLTHT